MLYMNKSNLIITFILSMFFFSCGGNKKEEVVEKPKAKVLPVKAQVLETKTLKRNFVSVGVLEPDEVVELSFESAGKVTEINFKEGKKVTKGELLAKINDAPLVAQLKKHEANIPVFKNRLERRMKLLETEAISQEDYDEALAAYNGLLADIELVKANIAKCHLVAPFDGVLGLRKVSEGAFVSTGTSVVQLAKTDRLLVRFNYPEQYTSLVKVGTNLSFTVTDNINEFPAKVYAINAVLDNKTKTLDARASYDNRDGLLVPGRFINVNVDLDENESALMLSNEALILEMGRSYVYKCSRGKVSKLEVKTGYRTEDELEVIEGIAVGDTIALSGLMQLRSGMAVKVDVVK